MAKNNAQNIAYPEDDALQKFVDEESISFPLVSDRKKAIKKLYGGGRITYLIDKTGTIRFVQKGVPDNDAFLDQLRELQ